MPQLIAAIDVGTTGTRTIIFDIYGTILNSAYEEYPSITPKPAWVEQDAKRWWRAACATSKKVLRTNSVNTQDILAVVVTNQRETIVPLDKAGEPLYNAIVWQDRRTTRQCEAINKTIGAKEIYRTTGLTIDPYFSAPKILWLKDHKTRIFKKTHKFAIVNDYIVHKLTGAFLTDHSNASRTMLFDIKKFNWSEPICEQLGIDIEKLPQPFESGTNIGELSTKAAYDTGLKAHTPVVVGGGDQQCAALGLGVTQEGLVCATTGTGTFILAPLAEPKLDPKMRMLCSASVLPKQWVLEGSIFTTGAVYRWFRDNFAGEMKFEAEKLGIDVYELMNQEVENAEAGAQGLLLIPHFAGAGAPYWDPNARGMLSGLALGHTKRDILRAIIEGICYEIKNSLEVFSELGINIRELRIAGGATRAKIWNQLQADIYGLPVVKTAYEETTALGAAILGTVGLGIYASPLDAVNNMVKLKTKFRPRSKLKKFYINQYLKHKKLYEKLRC